MNIIMQIYLYLFFVLFGAELFAAELPANSLAQLSIKQPHFVERGDLILAKNLRTGSANKRTELFLNDCLIGQVEGINSIHKGVRALDGSLYLLGGGDRTINHILHMNGDQISVLPNNFGLKDIFDIQTSIDGNLYIFGNDLNNRRVIVSMQNGVFSRPTNYGFSLIYSMYVDQEGRLLVFGEDPRDGNSIITVKDGLIFSPKTYNFSRIIKTEVAQSGDMYILGSDNKGNSAIITVRGKEVSRPTNYELRLTNMFYSNSDNILYLEGKNKDSKTCLVVVKPQEPAIAIILPDVIKIRSIRDTKDGIVYVLAENERDEAFVVTLRNNAVENIANYHLSAINTINVDSAGILYVSGVEQNKNSVVLKVTNENVENIPESFGSFEVKGVESLSQVIKSDPINNFEKEFKRICDVIKTQLWQRVSDKDGMILHDFLAYNRGRILDQDKPQILETYNDLCDDLAAKGSPLYFYSRIGIGDDLFQTFSNPPGFKRLSSAEEKVRLGDEKYAEKLEYTMEVLHSFQQMHEMAPVLFDRYKLTYLYHLLAIIQLEPKKISEIFPEEGDSSLIYVGGLNSEQEILKLDRDAYHRKLQLTKDVAGLLKDEPQLSEYCNKIVSAITELEKPISPQKVEESGGAKVSA